MRALTVAALALGILSAACAEDRVAVPSNAVGESTPDATPSDATPSDRTPTTARSSRQLPDVARLTCSEDRGTLLTPVVRAQPDGVHVRVEASFDTGFSWEAGGDNAPQGISNHVLPISPGRSSLGCYLKDVNADPVEFALTVRDPDKIWVAPDLDCKYVVSGIPEYEGEGKGEQGDPVELTRRDFAATGDEVFRAGYSRARIAQILVVRRGRAVHLVEWRPQGRGRWTMDNHQSCSARE